MIINVDIVHRHQYVGSGLGGSEERSTHETSGSQSADGQSAVC